MRKYKKPATISVEQALKKLEHYCAWQERCEQEVVQKLFKFGIEEKSHEQIIRQLSEDGFLDENRYASAFVRGKFNQNKWGKIKIKNQLMHKGINESVIEHSLDEIPEKAYFETLKKLTQSKLKDQSAGTALVKKMKTIRFLLNKGFEIDAIESTLKETGI